ncbi:MAG: VCBS repeat-containing protein [Myxococcota bacterium]
MARTPSVVLALLALGACSRTGVGDPVGSGAGADGGTMDAGARDASTAPSDAAPTDAASEDLGTPDAPRPRLAAPTPVSPWSGFRTGSALGPETALRPIFLWGEVVGASRYELQLTDACPRVAFGACSFEGATTVTTTALEHGASSLGASRDGPVGTRWFWRVRGCDDARCSSWSGVRYVDVGRADRDVDGDGYADLVVVTRVTRTPTEVDRYRVSEVSLHRGTPGGLGASSEPLLTSEDPDLAFVTPFVVDLDGDGFDDVALLAAYADGDAGRLTLSRRLGGPSGLGERSEEMELPRGVYVPVADHGPSDVDNDGRGDVVFLSGERGAFGIERVLGGPGGALTLAAYTPLGGGSDHRLTGTGAIADLSGDAIADAVVVANQRLLVVAGGAGAGAPMTSEVVTRFPARLFATPIALDATGNGRADIVVSDGWLPPDFQGGAHVFRAGDEGTLVAGEVLRAPAEYRSVGFVGTGGDVDGDGLAEMVLVGGQDTSTGFDDNQTIFVFPGAESGPGSTPSQTLRPPAGVRGIGLSVVLRDFDADGRADLALSATDPAEERLA